MTIRIYPSEAEGIVPAPPSKSEAHRALLCAGLAKGESVLTIGDPPFPEDVLATMVCLRALGARVRCEGKRLVVCGTDPRETVGALLPCRESGSTLRFLLPVALLAPGETVFTGSERLMQRPLAVYRALAAEKGLRFSEESGRLRVKGPLRGGFYRISGSVSSQFVSGLLFALPLCEEDSVIELIPPVVSAPYIALTRQMLARFGIETEADGETLIRVPGRQTYRAASVVIGGDWSGAAFLDALGLFTGKVTVTGLSQDTEQGDKLYPSLFSELQKGFCRFDLKDTPDLAPILFVLASLLHGAEFTGTARLRDKESDRACAMASELRKCGADITVSQDSVRILPVPLHSPPSPLDGHGDHRVVMALSVLLSRLGGDIEGADAVAKSFPGFFAALRQIGIQWAGG